MSRATTIAQGSRNATLLHVLNFVLKISFRSSDSLTAKNGLYRVMFADSAWTNINCGRTKAKYIAVHALAPFAKPNMLDEFGRKLFGIHVDEPSMYSNANLHLLYNMKSIPTRRLLRRPGSWWQS